MGLPAMKFEDSTTPQLRFKRIPGFSMASFVNKPVKDYTDEELAEVVRAIITSGVETNTGLRVHVTKPNPMFLFYQAVLEDMLADPMLDSDFKEKLYNYGQITTLISTQNPDLVKQLYTKDGYARL